jgi:hypothetical protein
MPATDLGASGGDGVVDEVRRDAVISRVWSTGSFGSWSDKETRPEEVRAAGASGTMRCHELLHVLGKQKTSEGALEQEEERETKKRRRDHLELSELSKNGRRYLRALARDFTGLVA